MATFEWMYNFHTNAFNIRIQQPKGKRGCFMKSCIFSLKTKYKNRV
jgi:hypothetical protein